jgi:glycosyltransferase involved in cell wall biosynthesis
MKLIVQIPAFNEETTIAQTLRDLPRKIDGIASIETLVIDDGSSDKTVEAARRAGANHVLLLKSHRGLSAAFVAGIDAALRLGADVIVNTDADNQYNGADVVRLVNPILKGTAEVVIGDRQVASSPHMSAFKRTLQRLGSKTVGLASGLSVADVTSGFRAFSREAALQMNVFNPFTYTLETIIQSGNRNLTVQSVPVRTNAPTRPSRLYRGIGTYMRKSMATIFRVYMMYRPLKTFFAIGSLLMLAGLALGGRFLYFFAEGERGGHIQSLILAAVFLITGFHTMLIGLLADLISANRKLSEDILIRVRRIEGPETAVATAAPRPAAAAAAPSSTRPQRERGGRPERPERNERPERPERAERPQRPERGRKESPAAASTPAPTAAAPAPQWVWLIDEEKLNGRNAATSDAAAKSAPPVDLDEDDDDDTDVMAGTGAAGDGAATPSGPRRRRRRRGGARQHTDLPGNRGKHLVDTE